MSEVGNIEQRTSNAEHRTGCQVNGPLNNSFHGGDEGMGLQLLRFRKGQLVRDSLCRLLPFEGAVRKTSGFDVQRSMFDVFAPRKGALP